MIQNPLDLLPQPIYDIAEEWSPCNRCPLHEGIFHYVFFRGTCPCDVLFIGEAPGKDDNLAGIPFVGKYGSILDSLIAEIGIDFTYGIQNIIACTPFTTTNGKLSVRVPSKEEADACKPRFLETIKRCNPKIIIELGKTAKKYLKLPKELSQIKVIEVPHPAYIHRKGGLNSLEYKRAVLYARETLKEILSGKEEEETIMEAR